MAGTSMYVRSPSFKRYTRGMKGFRNAWRRTARLIMAEHAEAIIERAQKNKPDLAGRSGELNRSWEYTNPAYRGGSFKMTVHNLTPYAGIVEEGVSNPRPNYIYGYFHPVFTTGHNRSMFMYNQSSPTSGFYYMPTNPWDGFFMLRDSIKVEERKLPMRFDKHIGDLAMLKGIN